MNVSGILGSSKMTLKQFYNCKILRNHEIIEDQLWVRDGKIVDPETIFFDEKSSPDIKIDCKGLIIAPGFIDIQMNGGYGVDFSYDVKDIEQSIEKVAKNIISNGVTSFCPTLVTSPPETYKKILSRIKPSKGGQHGANILGVHVEGPFINPEKKGAHPAKYIKTFDEGFDAVEATYGSMNNIKIVTLAPELYSSTSVIQELTRRSIVVSLGHSSANLIQGEEACLNGATLLTHLFNAMQGFHHRDPGLVGLLTSEKIPTPIFYGIISDGIHTHPAAVRMAYKAHPDGAVLVTDAVSALGLTDGRHHLGQLEVEVKGERAMIAGTDVLCGSTSNLNQCIQKFMKFTKCTPAYALEIATLHPAQVLGIQDVKGTLNYGADADFVVVTEKLTVVATWIAGEEVFSVI